MGAAAEYGVVSVGTEGTQTTTYIAGIKGVPLTGGQITVSSTGQLGIRTSSVRFKKQIKPMDKASETIFSLEPVTFQYKSELDPEGILQFGLVAEQVAEVDPNLVTRDEQGKPYTVRYEEVNAMLLNEFLKEHGKGQDQERKIEKLEATVAQLEVLLIQQKAQIQQWRHHRATTVGVDRVSMVAEGSSPQPSNLNQAR